MKLTIKEQDKEIEQYIRLVKATKIEHQKLFEENKELKENQKNKEQQQQQKEELEKQKKYYHPEKIRHYRRERK